MAKHSKHRHRFLVGTLFTLATVVGVVAVLAVWTNRQALNTDNWTSTSSRLLADNRVRTALSAYLVTELFKSVDVGAELKGQLPPQLQGLAGPAAAGLQQLAGQLTPRLLASSQVRDAWVAANRAAHRTLIKVINGGGKVVATTGGNVTLNVHELVAQLAASLGIQSQVAGVQSKLQGSTGQSVRNAAQQHGITLPPSSGQIKIMRANQLKTAQDVAGAIKGLAILLPLLMFALFILAVWLSKGRRRTAVRTTGWCFVAIGFITLLARRVIGNQLVDSLVKVPSNKPAVHDIWNIATTLLYDIGVAMIVYGLIFIVAAVLAGQSRPAIGLRRALAPSLRERPVAVYGAVAVAYLLVLAWGPTPAFRQVLPVVGIAVLVIVGVEALRRQTAREFPDAQPGDTMHALQSWNRERRRPAAPVPAPAGTSNGGHIAELERLVALHDSGALTDVEYESEKTALIHTA
jgi:sulfite exporter TauE/SafE